MCVCAGTVWALWGTEWVSRGLFGVTLGLGSGETALLKKKSDLVTKGGVEGGVNEGRL